MRHVHFCADLAPSDAPDDRMLRLLEGMEFESQEVRAAAREALKKAQAAAKAAGSGATDTKKKKAKSKLLYLSDVRDHQAGPSAPVCNLIFAADSQVVHGVSSFFNFGGKEYWPSISRVWIFCPLAVAGRWLGGGAHGTD